MKSIKELRKIWEKENETFKTKELGGLQNFVAEIFECPDLFDIKRGLESTKDKDRRNEYICEKTKKGRRADIVIFYKGEEIVIPVEVEKFNNIEAGVHQLADYQNDYQKSYGILTDGFNWRFYNNTVYKSFTVEQMFDNPSMIKTFWEEYLKEENYYLNFFQKNNDYFVEESLKVEENKELFFEDITKLILKFRDKLNIIGYLRQKEIADSDKKATEITYAYFIQFILYKNLVDNCYADFEEEFKSRIENIYRALTSGLYQTVLLEVRSISEYISKNLYKPFNEEQAYITRELDEILSRPKVLLEKATLWLDIIVFIKKYNFANIKNDIFGYIYENYLKEMYSSDKKGQYFTDAAVVNFMLDEIGFTEKNIRDSLSKNNRLSIVDPSCGSGTFLYSAVHRIVNALFDGSKKSAMEVEQIINDNVFGLDIAEFPLYLAEMSILMRMLPIIINKNYNNPIDKKIKVFKTQDSIAEFMNIGLSVKSENETGIDEETGQMCFVFDPEKLSLPYQSYIRDEDDLKEMKSSLLPPRKRYDFVIGNPPYLGYNECCKQKMLFTQLKDDIHMDNIFGINLNSVPGKKKSYSPKPNLYAYFIALGIALLKPNGRMCYIIPQTILTSSDLDVLRYYLSSKNILLEKIVTFSGKLFVGRGIKSQKPIATSSLILVVSKKAAKDNSTITVVNYHENSNTTCIEDILKSKKKTTVKFQQKMLHENIENWKFLIENEEETKFVEKYISKSVSIENFRQHLPNGNYDLVQFDKGTVFDKNEIRQEEAFWHLVKKTENQINIGTENYLPDEAVRYPKGSQGRGIFLNKYKIIWRYMNYDNFYFSDQKIMVDFNWVIISSDDKNEILFLLSILRSKLSQKIIAHYLKLENEKSINLGIKSVKQFIRIPKITESNNHIKTEIIKQTQKMLDLENKTLSDFADFSDITIQKFDSCKIEKHNLVLKKGKNEYFLPISNKCNIALLNRILLKKTAVSENIDLSELKKLSVFDKDEQDKIKDYIDDLLFALYFGIEIENPTYKNTLEIKDFCKQNEFYEIIN